VTTVALFRSVNGGDVAMIQGGKRLGFALKTREAFGVVCEHFGQDLDRDVAVELRVASSPNLAHTA
jgi:hypothetical protein